MTTALITGISGFVGSHLAEYLLTYTDWSVIGMMRWSSSLDNLQGVVPLINEGNVKLMHGDLLDVGSVREVVRLSKPDYIFHLAAHSFPLTSFIAPNETIETNVIGTLNLLDAVRIYSPEAWLHVCSSSEVYGRVDRSRLPINEECPFGPASPYAVSKIGADLMAQLYAEAYKLNIIVTRMFTHTGPRRGDVFAESSFAKQIAMIEAKHTAPPIMVGNLNSLRTVADVRDAVRAYHMALTVNPQAGSVYNIGGLHTCTVGDILSSLFDICGTTYDVETDETRLRPVDADLQVPDCTKFKEHTGWEPKIPFERTMTDLLNYWRQKVRVGRYLVR